jgi:proteasome lid subunit RPN8/RPN11
MQRKKMLKLSNQVHQQLCYLAKKYPHEVSGFGISTIEDPLHVIDFCMVEQLNDAASTEMTEEGLAAYMDAGLEAGMAPVQFMRIWIHTHPSGVNGPSGTDNTTMKEVFEGCDWSVMLILTKELKMYCEIHTKLLGKTIKTKCTPTIDYTSEGTTDTKAWEEEHDANHSPFVYYTPKTTVVGQDTTKGKNGTGKGAAGKQNILFTDEPKITTHCQTTSFWELDIIEMLYNGGEMDKYTYETLGETILAGQPLDMKWIDVYKNEFHDPMLTIASGVYN